MNWRASYYTFGTSRINYDVAQNFRVLIDAKKKSNLELLKDKIL